MSLNTIQGKRILFLCPAFFGYENKMTEKMKQMGAEVDYFDERSVKGAFERAVVKVFPALFGIRSDRYYEKIIEANKGKGYDYILIVRCDMVSIRILKKLKEVFTNAKICLYLWDSIRNTKGIKEKIGCFDTVHSFDLDDCKQDTRIKFRPLFFADEYRKQEKTADKYKYDLVFIGTAHTDRYEIIHNIEKIIDIKGIKHYWFLYLQNEFIYWVYFITKKSFRTVPKNTFSFKKLSASEIGDIVNKSKCVLDIEATSQTGLTMRTIEMLGLEKKLLTTNKQIKEYDFFNPNNIQIIDRNKLDIDCEFFNTPYEPVPEKIYENYSISSWVLDVLD